MVQNMPVEELWIRCEREGDKKEEMGTIGSIIAEMIQNNFQWAANNRIRVLDEWRKRYDGKSEPKK